MNHNLKLVNNFLKYLKENGVSSNSLKFYKSDIVNFLNWKGEKEITTTVVKEYLNSIRFVTPNSTVNRRLSTLRSFSQFIKSNFMDGVENVNNSRKVIKSWQNNILTKVSSKPKLYNFLNKLFFNRPNWYKKYHSYPISNYLHIAILIIFSSLSGYAVYDQVFYSTDRSLAYPTTLTRPNRYLSFQGRLTDNLGNPETTATNMVFKLYSVSSGGTALWNSGTCSITPDQDGIFSTLLGTTTHCPSASEITSDVFSENASVWVGITVGTDPEATPRIQIATVAYALNAETLQGFPAGTGTSTIPYIDSTGKLAIAASSPTVESTSGTFAIKGQAMTISTADTTNGDIIINPDGTGTLNLTFEGASPDGGANGFVNATNANITSGTLYGGTVASAATGYNFIDFKSGVSPTTKFSVDSTGAINTASGLTIGTTSLSETTSAIDSGAYLIGAFDEFDNSNSANVQAVLNDLDSALTTALSGSSIWTLNTGIIYPTTATNNFVIGGTTLAASIFSIDESTGTFLFGGDQSANPTLTFEATDNDTANFGFNTNDSFYFSGGNVGIGTTIPGSPLTVTSTSSTNYINALRLENLGSGAGTGTGMLFQSVSGTSGAKAGIFALNTGGGNGRSTLNFATDNTGDTSDATTADIRMTITPAGNVGVNNTNPSALFDVVGTASVSGALTMGDGTTNVIRSAFGPLALQAKTAANTWGTRLSITDTTGYIGINGETSPVTPLHITTASAASLTTALTLDNNSAGGAGTATGLRFKAVNDTVYDTYAKSGIFFENSGVTSGIGKLYFAMNSTADSSNATISDAKMTLVYNGNLGIGTISPTSKLHLSGAVTGKALAIFDETGNQSMFTASASGITKFELDNSGNAIVYDQGDLRLNEATANGSNYAGFQAPTSLASNNIYTLPTAYAGAATGYFLTSDTSGVMSWSNSISAGSLKWNALSTPDGSLTLDHGTNATTFGWTPTGALDAFTFNINNNGGSATNQNGLIINNADVGSFTDTATESLLKLQQLDATTTGTTAVTDALLINSAGSSGIVDAIHIANTVGNLTNGINIADTTGTIDKGIVLSGTFTTAGIDAGNSIITNIGNANTDFDSTGGLTLAGNLTVQGTTGLTFSTGVGGDITFANLEKIDNDTDGTVSITAPITAVSGDLKLTGADILDTNSNEFLRFTSVASAVDEITIANAAANGIVTLAATGGDTDIALSIDSKGADALNLNGTATGDVNIAGGSGSTGCTIANSTGNLTCSGTISGTIAATSLPWSGLTSPTAALSLNMTTNGQYATTFGWTPTGALDAFTFNINNNGGSATNQNGLIINNADVGSFTDTATESLLKLQQLDATTTGTTAVTDALLINSAGSSGIVDAIHIANTVGNLTNGINIADTTGTIDKGIVLSGTFTTAGIDAGNSIITNIGNANTDFDSTGGLTLAGTLTANGIVSLGDGGDLITISGSDTNVAVIDGSTVNLDGDGSPTANLFNIGSGDTSITSGVDGLFVNLAMSNASGDSIHVTPSFAGGATDALTYNGLEFDAFSPTNATGTDTVNGIRIGILTDPGATITSTALNVRSGWDTILGGTTAGTNILSFTNATLSNAGNLSLQGTGYFDSDVSNASRSAIPATYNNTNIAPNPSLEVSSSTYVVDGYINGANASSSVTKTSSQNHDGAYSVALQAVPGELAQIYSKSNIPIIPSTSYSLSAWAKYNSTCGGDGFFLRFKWMDQWGNHISWSHVVNDNSTGLSTSWAFFDAAFTSPANAYSTKIEILNYLPTTGCTIYIDQITVRQALEGIFDISSPSTTSGYWLDGKLAVSGETTDNWLRLNQSSSWTNGTYTPGALRVDGEIRQGTTDYGAYEIQTTGDLYVALTSTLIGNVGIGTTTPNGALEINHSTGNNLRLTYNDSDGSALNRVDFATSATGDLSITPSGGDVNILAANLSIPLDKALYFSGPGGNPSISFLPSASPSTLYFTSGSTRFTFDSNVYITGGRLAQDTWTADGDTAVYKDNTTGQLGVVTSDRRLKKNITELLNPLEIVKKINAYKYNDLDEEDGSKLRLGVMSQELLPILPELTFAFNKSGSNETYYGVHYDKLTVLLLGAIKEIDNKFNALSSRVVASIGEFNKVETNIISPVANTDLIIDLQPDDSKDPSMLAIKGQDNQIVASIDSNGQITANEIEINYDATISGTLYANDIQSTKINEIEDLLRSVETNQSLLASSLSWETNTATNSASFASLMADQIISKDILASNSISASSLYVSENLTANNINSLDTILQIQSLALNPIEIMAGKINIDTEGNATFLGNVEIAGDLKINNLVVANNTEQIATGSGTINVGEINTNAVAGKAVLPANTAEIKIVNPKVSQNTLIYITPISSTQNKVLYVKAKNNGWFTIGFSDILDSDVEFNWWIIELQ
jgi:hypothetical protein